MSDYVIPAHATSRAAGDAYLMLLGGVLLGYAVIGKGFAYIGAPPLFIGEMGLLLGIVVFLRSGCLFASLATLPAVLLTVTMAWVLLRTVPYIREYGFDAARDSVIVMYGIFAFIVIAVLLQDPRRIRTIMRGYLVFTGIFIFSMPILAPASHFLKDYIPFMPGHIGVPMLQLRAGEVATHLAGAAVFAMAGFRKTTLVWVLALVAVLVMVSALSRGAMFAAILPICFAAVMLGHWRKLIVIAIGAGFLFSVAYSIEISFTERTDYEIRDSDSRTVTPTQIVDNFASLFGQGSGSGEGTARWRLNWWTIVIDETIFGEYFWTGRGFGANLAFAHGFGWQAPGEVRPMNRSPHNATISVLGRAGVPGLVLWILLSTAWLLLVLKAMLHARRHGNTDWANLFLFVFCYVLAVIINAQFDVALEGPMQGIWYWCLFGFGLGAVMIYRAQPREHQDIVETR